MKIVVAGPGLMGSQIGAELAIGGSDVTFLVHRLAEAERRVAAAFDLAASLELWPAGAVSTVRESIAYAGTVDELDPASELFLESIVEERGPKVDLLAAAATRLPTAILASNTSSISIDELGDGCGAPDRVLGMHFWNPPLLMPLVEVISGPATAPRHVDTVVGLIRGIGKRPVVVDRDVPGFVWNRLQLALLREAVWIVEHGVASPAVVDEIVRDGLARRWRYTGPFQTAALGGPDTFTRVADNLWPVLSTATGVEALDRWLTSDPDALAAVRAARDAGLLDELKRDRTITSD